MCSSLEGLPTNTADMTAVLAMSLPAVAPQRIGILAHLVTVVTLVPVISLRLVVFHTLEAITSNLD